MDVLLVDLILGDHSGPYASNIKRELKRREEISNVDFLTLESDERLTNFFDSTDDVFFIDQDNGAGYSTPIVDSFVEMIEFIQQHSYTVVHILQVDNVLLESAITLPTSTELPPVVAQINGAFFGRERNERPPAVHRFVSGLLSLPLASVVERALIWNKSSALVNDISLYNCLKNNTFDQLLVHTDAAKDYVLDMDTGTTPVTVVPEPSTVEPPGFSQEYARQLLGLDSEEPVLLFFGGLREEKGIYRLLDTLQDYDGQAFILIIAGRKKGVTDEDFRKVERNPSISIFTDFGYIYDSEQYFVAADGVLCPYLDEFGEERTSHVFQEAIRLRRPVICPAFGSFESRLNSYNLGVLYSPNTGQALNNAIHRFVENPEKYYSTEDMIRFSEEHSFETLSSTLVEIYRSVS